MSTDRTYDAHFQDPQAPGRTLCGQEHTNEYIWRSDTRADCKVCVNVWVKRTGWSFPLPELVVV